MSSDSISVKETSGGQPVETENRSGTHTQAMLTSMVTFAHTRVTIPTGASSTLVAANSDRVAGAFIFNNTSTTFWVNIGAAAVSAQCVPLYPQGSFPLNSKQAYNAYQSSGTDQTLDVYEAT